ncbi:Na+/H+ antiporter NhaC [Enterocloster lavalensis]|uniref:Transporter, NhaC family n=1 Tax=Enterocloster lavalensis TaxID=460384 RepID=A0A1I0B2G8_9FIRM|nr:Na+/H+ antiporter NhaC [Enterocloster lavalensis]PST32709.1 Na+/H+ antiporter NhaC [Enterocloster lavalensis]SET00522.1 transporter, NhaC family [Enterocloster lavalensis]
MKKESGKPSLFLSVTVLAVIAVVLTAGIIAGVPTIPLLVVNIFLVLIISMLFGYPYRELEEGMMSGVKRAMDCVIILLFVGVLIGAWIKCGTVPMIIYYGLSFITPRMLLPLTFVMCSLLSLCIGTSLGTAGTMGVACVSIGVSMGIPIPIVAGAAISGSVLGDKLSPLSDSTILASSASDINIYYHVRSMMYTTIPAVVISLVIFYFLGAQYAQVAMDPSVIESVRVQLAGLYHFNILLLIPVVLIVILSIRKVPAILAILISGFAGLALAVLVQKAALTDVLAVVFNGVKVNSGMELVDTMLSKGGISSMMNTICTAVLALALGGILSEAGFLHTLVERITGSVRSDRAAILVTLVCGILTVMLVTNFYVSAVLMGTMFRELYDRRGIHRSVLSRTIEEANTIILPLVPWNTGCIYYMGLFGFTTLSFAPYVVFAYANIAVSVICALAGIFIFKAVPGNSAEADWSVRGRAQQPFSPELEEILPEPLAE